MAQTIIEKTVVGNMRMVVGTADASGSTVDVVTGLKRLVAFLHNNQTTANGDKISISGGTVTVTTAGAADSINWVALGY